MISICHNSANLVMPNCDPWDRFFYPTLTLMMDCFIIHLSKCFCRSILISIYTICYTIANSTYPTHLANCRTNFYDDFGKEIMCPIILTLFPPFTTIIIIVICSVGDPEEVQGYAQNHFEMKLFLKESHFETKLFQKNQEKLINN